jgi:hypothetical protein
MVVAHEYDVNIFMNSTVAYNAGNIQPVALDRYGMPASPLCAQLLENNP